VELKTNTTPLVICVMHLALGSRARNRQLAYISDLVAEHPYLIVMGDFNCGVDSPELCYLIENTHLELPAEALKTFPSWRPRHRYDHILVSDQLRVSDLRVLDPTHSDHLPVSVRVELPENVRLLEGRSRPPTLLAGPE
jgi:endonuclease/exonuclease/phosphatase family metal-dependent hydrolase